ncbi:anthrone oxygenase family protein [Cyclobacterium xiamenense]|uniref:anthrone oxygenase family protein n=1 Tax=Cyclobacterium xiamenense TaxID=1297121 RepID=UPI0035D07E36
MPLIVIYFTQVGDSNRWLLIAGFFTYILVIGITAGIHVPLTNQLERLNVLNTSGKQLETFRMLFVNRWTFWNNVKTVSSLLSSILLTLYLLLPNR